MNETTDVAVTVTDWQPARAPLDMPRQVLERDRIGALVMAFSRLFLRNA
ncbi:MAG: hypothetical protein KKB02_16715 [Alphaproteobacteria bacterium]|nr:hypothetical protein [Alphaproteobacteria bacterium]